MLTKKQVEKTISFHGHSCPGLAIGMRASQWCQENLGCSDDEEIVAIVECDMCGVDAIQFLTGCTFGKGNLIFRDYGKAAFTFYRRSDGRGNRLLWKRSVLSDLQQKQDTLSADDTEGRQDLRRQMIERILSVSDNDAFAIEAPREPLPPKAQIRKSSPCDHCGEEVMETRLEQRDDRRLCRTCAADSQ